VKRSLSVLDVGKADKLFVGVRKKSMLEDLEHFKALVETLGSKVRNLLRESARVAGRNVWSAFRGVVKGRLGPFKRGMRG